MANLPKAKIAELTELILVSDLVPMEKKFEWINVVPNLPLEKAQELKILLEQEQAFREGKYIHLDEEEKEMVGKYETTQALIIRKSDKSVRVQKEDRNRQRETQDLKRIEREMDKIFNA